MADLRYIGKERARPDAADKASGRAHYVHDLLRPGMLHGKIKFSEHAHARIEHIDTRRAERLPGVRAVITGYDTPELRIGFLRDNFALKRDRVRQFRDEVAAVAAIDPDVAAEAVELIEVEYEPLPAVFSPEEALEEGAPLLHEFDAGGATAGEQPRGRDLPSRVGGRRGGGAGGKARRSRGSSRPSSSSRAAWARPDASPSSSRAAT